MPSFDGNADFFGFQTTEVGPIPSYRKQREIIPGVNGYRNYRLGFAEVRWTLTGWLQYEDRADLALALLENAAMADGATYDFVDSAGNTYPDCELESFAPTGPPFRCIDVASGDWVYRQQITCVVVWTAPT